MAVKKLLVSHGPLAAELLASAERIVGEVFEIEALSLDWDEGCDAIEEKLRTRLAEIDEGDGVLLLTDLFGATPTQAAKRVLEPGRYEMVTGMNLAMIVRIACHPPAVSVSDLAEWIQEKGRGGIRVLAEAPESAPEDPRD